MLGGAEIIGKLSMLILTVGAARMLGVADFGAFSYALAIGTLIAVVPQWGYDVTVIQRASAEPGRLRQLLAELLAMRTLLVVLALAVVGALSGLTSLSGSGGSTVGLLIIAAVLIDTYTEAYRAATAALQRQIMMAVVHLVQRLLTAGAALLALATHTGLTGLAVAFFAGTAVGPLTAAVLMRCHGHAPDWRSVSSAGLVELNRGTWVIGVASLVLMVLFRIDTVMIAWFAGDHEVGIYAAVYRLLETTLFVSFVTARTIFPLMASAPEPTRVRRYSEQGLSMMAAVFLPYMVLLWCRGHGILDILYGPEFADQGTAMLAWLAPAPFLYGVSYLASYAIVAAGPTPRALAGALIALAVNMSLNLALIPRYGGIAAACTTSLSYAVYAAALILLGRPRAGLPRLPRAMLPSVAASAVACGPLLAPWPFVPAVLTAVVLYVPCWLLATRRVDPQQVQVLDRMLRRGRVV
ncbi:oligosaccharide flippase family protein [Streptomyces canus]|uniref:oligosaccharide flippase family protein n=1 Tax=Streptomyces canus TaxID=58343 RepID=UPI0003807B6D|nr:oligosaccharide flippase family protein [Streptomyces canus]